jgi:hypothetical protein
MPLQLYHGRKKPHTHWLGDWVGPRQFWPYRDSNSDPSVVQPVLSRYTDCTRITVSGIIFDLIIIIIIIIIIIKQIEQESS